MVDDELTVIIDVGMCLRVLCADDGAQRRLINSRPCCGKLYYMAPEVYNEEPFHGCAVDMWAVGVCLFMMLTGQPSWDRASRVDRRFRYCIMEILPNI